MVPGRISLRQSATMETSAPLTPVLRPSSIFQKFPPELHYSILENADVSQYSTFRLVCARWYRFIENNLPLGRYVPATISFDSPLPKWQTGTPIPNISIASSVLLVHRGIFIFSRYRIDPKRFNMVRVTTGIDLVNVKSRRRIQKFEAGKPITDAPLARILGINESATGKMGLFCGRRDISYYLPDPVYVMNPRHKEYSRYRGRLDMSQKWRLIPSPQTFQPPAGSCESVREWLESFLNYYDWEQFDANLPNFGQPGIGLSPSYVEIAAYLASHSLGFWKPIKKTEQNEGVVERKSIEIVTEIFIWGCRYRTGRGWTRAKPDTTVGFTFPSGQIR